MAGITKFWLDLGFGALKYAASNGTEGEIVSHVVRPKREADLALLGMQASKCLTINNGFGKYLVGLGATDHTGTIEDSTNYERISDAAPEVRALFYAALSDAQVVGNTSVVVALPLGLATLSDAKQRMADLRNWMAKEHRWEVGRAPRVITVTKVSAISQAQAVYFDHTLDDAGGQRRPSDGLIVTVSIGSNTVEIMGFEDGAPAPRFARGARIGVRYMFGMFNEAKYRGVREITAIDADYRRGKLKRDQLAPAINNWHNKIGTEIRNVFGDELERVGQVVVAGGGADLAIGALRSLFPGDGRVVAAVDPVRAVVRGMVKWDAARGG